MSKKIYCAECGKDITKKNKAKIWNGQKRCMVTVCSDDKECYRTAFWRIKKEEGNYEYGKRK